MILPILQGFLSFKSAPITWILFFFNVIVFIFTLSYLSRPDHQFDSVFKDPVFAQTNGQIFAQFILQHKKTYPETLQALATAVSLGDLSKTKTLGTVAVGDQFFMDEALNVPFRGDQVAYQVWKEDLRRLQTARGTHPSYVLGLDSADCSWTKWISYQFAHSGIVHIAGNMLFLLIFGCALEPVIGSLELLIVYLLCGMVAGGVFLLANPLSLTPLVGASGSISGLMALFCFLFWRRPVRYIYFLFIPKKGFAGFVYLPAWLILFCWMLPDLGGYLSALPYFGGVAYAAHLGGECAGFLVGAVLFMTGFASHRETPSPQTPEQAVMNWNFSAPR